jgi:hypothetical protein
MSIFKIELPVFGIVRWRFNLFRDSLVFIRFQVFPEVFGEMTLNDGTNQAWPRPEGFPPESGHYRFYKPPPIPTGTRRRLRFPVFSCVRSVAFWSGRHS